MDTVTALISYSHDDESHKNWVLQLATRLRKNGVDAILDRWNLKLGSDLPSFMEQGLSKSHRVICICSEKYVKKANEGQGGVGYEKRIMTAELLQNGNTNWVIPLIRNNPSPKKLPTFLGGRMYIDFDKEEDYEKSYEELLRDLLGEFVLPLPELGENPFKAIRVPTPTVFTPGNERYLSPGTSGRVRFNILDNSGLYTIGSGTLMFETKWTFANHHCVHAYNDPPSINTVALARGKKEISEVDSAQRFDTSSRTRMSNVGEVLIYRNVNGYYAALKILSIKTYEERDHDAELTFDYVIQTNGSDNFSL